MKNAADFRKIARDALRGRWFIAVIVGLVASILGATGGSGPDFNVNYDASGINASIEMGGQTIYSTGGSLDSGIGTFLIGGLTIILIVALLVSIVLFLIGSFVELGYARFNLNLVDGEEAEFANLFEYVSIWKTAIASRFLQYIYIFLWTLLLIIPGIMAAYSYAMTEYILAEHPELSASEAISRSKTMMKGHRFRLFCLEFSFIGWDLLCMLTLGIGYLWLNPYRHGAKAAFYREVSGTEHIAEDVYGQWSEYNY